MAQVQTFEYDELPEDMKELADGYISRGASWDHIRVLAHRPEIYAGFQPFLYALHTTGVIGPDLKELVRLRIGDLNECAFCKKGRHQGAFDNGLTDEKVANVANHATDPMYSEREHLALELADKMAMDHTIFDTEAGDELFINLRRVFSDAEIVELGMAIGQYIGFGRFLHAFQVINPVCELAGSAAGSASAAGSD